MLSLHLLSALITKCFGKESSPLPLQDELPPSVQSPAALLSGADNCTLVRADKEWYLEVKYSRDREITPPLLHLNKLSLNTENPFHCCCEEVLPSGLESLPKKSGAEEFLQVTSCRTLLTCYCLSPVGSTCLLWYHLRDSVTTHLFYDQNNLGGPGHIFHRLPMNQFPCWSFSYSYFLHILN